MCLDLSLTPSLPDPDPDPERARSNGRAKRPAYPDEFEAGFWAPYPLKVGKGAALRAWLRARPPAAAIATALAWQITSDAWTRDGGRYIPNPATYLSQRRWEDEPRRQGLVVSDKEARNMESERQYLEMARARDARG